LNDIKLLEFFNKNKIKNNIGLRELNNYKKSINLIKNANIGIKSINYKPKYEIKKNITNIEQLVQKIVKINTIDKNNILNSNVLLGIYDKYTIVNKQNNKMFTKLVNFKNIKKNLNINKFKIKYSEYLV
jgi:hypothetical protein